jgi:hypothetical protein
MWLILSFIPFQTKSRKVSVTTDVTKIQWTRKGDVKKSPQMKAKAVSDVTVNLTRSTEQKAARETQSLSPTQFYNALSFIPSHIIAQGSSISW